MCSKLLRHERQHGVVYNVIERGIGGLTAGYRRLLGLALRMRFVVVLIGLVVAAGGGLLLTQLKSELAPIEDQGTVVSIDRKSVVWGKSVSVRVDLGGRRIIKKKKNEKHTRIRLYQKT